MAKQWQVPPLHTNSAQQPSLATRHAGDDPARDALTAAARLVSNRAAVVPFALRGATRPAVKTARAHLSDPGRPSAHDPEGSVDAGRHRRAP